MDENEKPIEAGSAGSGLLVLYVCALATQTSFSVTLLAVPIYALRLGASDPLIGLIGAVGGATYAVMARLFGLISDRFSKRLLAVVALSMQTVACLLFTLIQVPELLALARLLQATGSALFWPIIEAHVADLAPSGRLDKSLKGYNLGWGTGSIIGPQIGGLLISLFTVLTPFYFSAVTCLAMIPLLASIRTSRRPMPDIRLRDRTEEKSNVRTSRRAYVALVSGTLFSFSGGIVSTLFPAFATRLGLQPYEIGMLFLLSGLTQTIVFSQADKIESRLGLTVSLLAGSGILFLSLLAIPFTSSLVVYMVSFSGQGVASGLLYAVSLSLLLKESGPRHGRATGLWESTIGSGFFAGPLIGGAIAGILPTAPYFLGASASALTAAVQLRLLQQGQERQEPSEGITPPRT